MNNAWRTVALILTALRPAFAAHPLTTIHTIHWNATNPLFRRQILDADNDVINVNSGNHPWEYDQVNIVCPTYDTSSRSEEEEQYIIYSVTEREYRSCRIMQPNPKIVAVCNRPHAQMYFTITFRSFTPTPGGLEFRPGQDYYFVSTSSRGDLHRRVGGFCSSDNMKIVFRVAPKTDPPGGRQGGGGAGPRQMRFPWSNREDFRRTFSSPLRVSPESHMMNKRHSHSKPAMSELEAGGNSGGGIVASPSIKLLAAAMLSSFAVILARH